MIILRTLCGTQAEFEIYISKNTKIGHTFTPAIQACNLINNILNPASFCRFMLEYMQSHQITINRPAISNEGFE